MIRFVLVLILFSCNNRKVNFQLEDIDKIEIKDYQSGFIYVETNKEVIQNFNKVLKGNAEKTDCAPIGSISFIKGTEIEMKVGFTINPQDCEFLILNTDSKPLGFRLNYRSGMYLSENFYELKVKNRTH